MLSQNGRHLMMLIAGMAITAISSAQSEFLPVVKEPNAPLPDFTGIAFEAEDAQLLHRDGRMMRPDKASALESAKRRRGLAVIGIDPSVSVLWTIPKSLKSDKYYLYFRVRSGHQRGYEYIVGMSYRSKVNGREIPLEPIMDVAPVRVYRAPHDAWFEDVSWVRSVRAVQLSPHDRIALGCKQPYAYVDKLVLVNKAAGVVNHLMARAGLLKRRREALHKLLQRIADAFSVEGEVSQAVMGLMQQLQRVQEYASAYQQQLDEASQAVQRNARVDVKGLKMNYKRLRALHNRCEWSSAQQLITPFRKVAGDLDEIMQSVRTSQETYSGREATYAREVAAVYLSEARKLLRKPVTKMQYISYYQRKFYSRSIDRLPSLWLRRVATYLWRAQQFARVAMQNAQRATAGAIKSQSQRSDTPLRQSTSPLQNAPLARATICISGEWEFSTNGAPGQPPKDGWETIHVPHGPWHEWFGRFGNLNRKWDGKQHWMWYRRKFTVPAGWRGGRIKIRFEAVFHYTEVFLNGIYCGNHYGGFDQFEIDITDACRFGEPNELLVFVYDTSKTQLGPNVRDGQPSPAPTSGPNHYVISDLWGANFGGIWQDVSVCLYPPVHVADVFIQTSVRRKEIKVELAVRNESAEPVALTLVNDAILNGKIECSLPVRRVKLNPGEVKHLKVRAKWSNPQLWGIGGRWGKPVLYTLRTRLLDSAGRALDTHFTRFGFREFWIEDGRFMLNGKPIFLQGGGTWYLQESKIANGHRWFAIHHYRIERSMNVNIERFHRHGDVAKDFFDVADELGMLCEPEGAYWGCTGVPDILGEADFDDPVWVRNVEEHYRKWVRKHRNHPSIVLWSIENETLTRSGLPHALVERLLQIGMVVKREDPTRPITYHGCANGDYPLHDKRFEIVNWHYPPASSLMNWRQRYGGRPVINGEFQNYPPHFRSMANNREVARRAIGELSNWIESTFRLHRKIGIAGASYFLPSAAGLFATDEPYHQGPWWDLFRPIETYPEVKSGWFRGGCSASIWVPIRWASLSGRGIKAERLLTGTGFKALINWFDKTRAVATPTDIYDAIKRSWEPMPPLNEFKSPEVIVQVSQSGKPVVGQCAFIVPLDGQPVNVQGVLTDSNGKAWFVVPLPGRYRIWCDGFEREITIHAKYGRTDAPPGYDDIPIVGLEL